MTANNPITELLGAPLGPDWTVEGLAEQVLGAIAAQRSQEAQEFVLDADATTDRQSRRLLRPLLACLATKSAAEAGMPANLYGGHFSFKRPGPKGPVWVLGQFENRPGSVRVTFRRSNSPPEGPKSPESDEIGYTYTTLARKLTALGMRCANSHHSPPHHLWVNPDSGCAVVIPDLGDKPLSQKTIDKLVDQLGLSRAQLDEVV